MIKWVCNLPELLNTVSQLSRNTATSCAKWHELIPGGPTTRPPNHKGPDQRFQTRTLYIQYYLVYHSSIPHLKHHIDNFMETVSAPIQLLPFWLVEASTLLYCTRLNWDHLPKYQQASKYKFFKTTKQSYILYGVKGNNLTNCTELRPLGIWLFIWYSPIMKINVRSHLWKLERLRPYMLDQASPIQIKEQQAGT